MSRLAIVLASSGVLVALMFSSHGFAAGSAAAGGVTLVAEKATVERPRHPRIVRKRPNGYEAKYEKGGSGKDTEGASDKDKSGGTSGSANDKGGSGGGGGGKGGGASK